MKTNKLTILQFCIPIFLGVLLFQCTGQSNKVAIKNVPFEKDYITYGSVLQKFVVGELVDYRALNEDRGSLDDFVSQLATISKSDLEKMSKPEKMAFWINAYNSLTLRSIIDAYPVESIKDINGVWDKKKWKVAGRSVTLDQIEHEILRPVFKDARVHFAVNCASIGCPPLMNKPFLPDLLDQQLDLMTRRFVNHPKRNKIDPDKKLINTSELFSWFGDDFISGLNNPDIYPNLSREDAAVISFIFNYIDSAKIIAIDPDLDWSLAYDEYDWNLNEVK